MRCIFRKRSSQRLLAEQNQLAKTFLFYRSYPALTDRVAQIVAHQKKWNADPQRRLGPVRITHSSSMAVWKTEAGRALLRYQKEFITFGGLIVRILLDVDQKPTDEHQAIIRDMQDANIFVFYLQGSDVHRLTDDFMWVDNFELKLAVGGKSQNARGMRISGGGRDTICSTPTNLERSWK
jgi:hypothetical protein